MTSEIPWPKFDPNESQAHALVKLSRYYGSDPTFILAGGGNTSLKTAERLLIKASGHSLATITAEGFVEMDRRALHDVLDEDFGEDVDAREEKFKAAILGARVEPEKGQRPSVECTLHNLVPGRYVAHTHPTLVNMVTCCQGGEQIARELFGEDVLWVPFVDPGYTLARTLRDALRGYTATTGRDAPAAIFMANHGLIVSGETPDEIHNRTDAIVEQLRTRVGGAMEGERFVSVTQLDAEPAGRLIERIGPALRGLLSPGGQKLRVVTFDDSDLVMSLAGSAEGRDIVGAGPLSPDQIVYCKSMPLWLDISADDAPRDLVAALRQAVEEYEERHGFRPLVVFVRGLGMFTAGEDFASADTVREVYRDAITVMAGARRLGGVRYMTERDREFIEHWEVEAYRRQIAAAKYKAGRADGKIAVVTGAAQGFGLEIAQDLAAQGAHVVLTDVNIDGARSGAAELCARHGRGRATAVEINVTQAASVEAAVHQVVRTYGGLDLLVSNAGVLRAGSVKTQPPDDFAFVTDVNYRGYFHCVQKAAPIMAVQHMAREEYTGDVIQVNSKSGLVGSNRNGAYAGSKFGGIGLTQSFAMELIADGIKVNAVCPGNFFDGPLWSDPETGLFVQYLRTGKVPGAATIEDVRAAYEAKVPMGRGCTAADVMKAIYYLMDQQYETGQALPVTGGQVMLS